MKVAKAPLIGGFLLCLVKGPAMAQCNQQIQLQQIAVDKGTQWTGYNVETYTKVRLHWQVAGNTPIQQVLVERSFDRVHFYFAGNASVVNALDAKSMGFRFEDRAMLLNRKSIAHYRIRYTDVAGNIGYSEARPVSL